jgi:3-(3-hydroxy-phenyl)propionate hydroxylase
MIPPRQAASAGAAQLPTWEFIAPPELASGITPTYPVVIVGGGLVGLAAACDLATRGIASVLLDDDNTVGVRGAASRGIAYAQKTLEIFERLGIYERVAAKGVRWSVGRTLAGDEELFSFDLAPSSLSLQPPFINLQQYYVEWFLVERIHALGLTDLRWLNQVTGFAQHAGHCELAVQTPQGDYTLRAQWVIDASGVNSMVREAAGIAVQTAFAQDRWCICDVRFTRPMPLERWTWIEAPFNQNRAVWQHPMADEVWRLDYQQEPDADPERMAQPEVAEALVRRHLGSLFGDVPFEMVWVGPWTYRNQLAATFRRGRLLLAGDCAHAFSPFGGRGGNSGVQDAENLAWKLVAVLQGRAPEALLDSYDGERRAAAAHNIAVTAGTMRFLRPASPGARATRDAILALARRFAFAKALVNTGRMSVAHVYESLPGGGQSLPNVPLEIDGRAGALVDLLRGACAPLALWFAEGDAAAGADALAAALEAMPEATAGLVVVGAMLPGRVCVQDSTGKLAAATHAAPGEVLLVRPDMHLAARMPATRVAQLAAGAARVPGQPWIAQAA